MYTVYCLLFIHRKANNFFQKNGRKYGLLTDLYSLLKSSPSLTLGQNVFTFSTLSSINPQIVAPTKSTTNIPVIFIWELSSRASQINKNDCIQFFNASLYFTHTDINTLCIRSYSLLQQRIMDIIFEYVILLELSLADQIQLIGYNLEQMKKKDTETPLRSPKPMVNLRSKQNASFFHH